jgi:5-(carboxyamino)imidazole ribonucleotide synthase
MENRKIGVLGGGQLGKMLCQAASRYHLNIHVLENDRECPASYTCAHFAKGNITSFDDVYQFGKQMDIITIEIESVNLAALDALEKEGKKIYPQPSVLKVITDKGLQKSFYQAHQIPTSHFALYDSKADILDAVASKHISFPFVQKLRRDGYDGRGVQIIRHEGQLGLLFDAPSVVEALVDIDKEISVIVSRNEDGKITAFPVVEMEFHPEANLVEFLFCPSDIGQDLQTRATALACKLAADFEIVGLLAVEMFVTRSGEILVNEVAPRPHNSGHQTIEANYTSQYEQHLRCILNWPLGDTGMHHASVMVNLLGEECYSGKAVYSNMEQVLDMPGVYVHIYGKKETKPFRKMGHVTVVSKDLTEAVEKARIVKNTLKIIS